MRNHTTKPRLIMGQCQPHRYVVYPTLISSENKVDRNVHNALNAIHPQIAYGT